MLTIVLYVENETSCVTIYGVCSGISKTAVRSIHTPHGQEQYALTMFFPGATTPLSSSVDHLVAYVLVHERRKGIHTREWVLIHSAASVLVPQR